MLTIGLVHVGNGTNVGLAAAARRHPGIAIHPLAPDAGASNDFDALIVDAPVVNRTELIERFSGSAPILTESPATTSVDAVVSANPLRYALHTRRLIEAVRHHETLLELISITQRARRTSAQLVHILDLVQALQPGEIEHVASLQRETPSVILASLRYSSGTLVSLELGAHLPSEFPSDDELAIECFSTERAYHCMPGNQSVACVGARTRQVSWQPDVADSIVANFLEWLQGGPRPPGSGRVDQVALALAERITADQ